MFFRVSFLILCLILHSFPFVIIRGQFVAVASRTIIAIDDTFGDAVTGIKPVYNPPTKWIQGQPCISGDKCLVDPDPKEAWNSTWHDAAGATEDAPPRTIDFGFEGNSIGVYCIVPQVGRVETATANMTFELDGELVGRFFQGRYEATENTGDRDIQYNVAVYQNGSIPQGHHALRITSIGHSRTLFDYALYTTESDAQSTTPSALPLASLSARGEHMANGDSQRPETSDTPNLGVIVGAVAGGALLLIAVGIMAVMLIRRLRRSTENLRRAGTLPEADQPAYGEHDPLQSDRRSVLSSTDSATLENDRPLTPFYPFNYSDPFISPTSISLTNGDTDRRSVGSLNASPTDSIPLVEFPTSPSINQPLHRIIVTGSETHLIGPDNSIAHFARQQMAEREAELTRRTHETEAVLPAKNGVFLSSIKEASISVGLSSDSGGSPSIGSSSIGAMVGPQTPREGVEGGDRANESHAEENGAMLPGGAEHGGKRH